MDYAEVWMLSSAAFGPSTFHVIGRDASNNRLDLIIDSPVSPDGENHWMLFGTFGAGFTNIESIRLSGNAKGFFDDLAVNVVPEPATCIMLGVGLGGLIWVRRRRTSCRHLTRRPFPSQTEVPHACRLAALTSAASFRSHS